MTPKEINIGVMKTILKTNYTTTPVHWPGKSFDPKIKAPDNEYIKPELQFGGSFELEKADGIGLRSGLVRVKIFTPANKGVNRGYTIAGVIEDLYRRSYAVVGMTFGEPSTTENGIEDGNGFQMHTTEIFFTTFIGEE